MRRVKPNGPAPEEFRSRPIAALPLFTPSKFWGRGPSTGTSLATLPLLRSTKFGHSLGLPFPFPYSARLPARKSSSSCLECTSSFEYMALRCVRTVFFEMVRCSAIQFALRPWANRSRISSSRADRPYTGLEGSHNEIASPPSCAATKGAPSTSCERGPFVPHAAVPPAAASPPPTEAFASLRGSAPEAPETDAPPATEPFAAIEAAAQA